MSIIATALKHMIAAGMSGDDLVRAVAEMEAALVPAAPVRSKGAARQARYEERERQKASESVSSDDNDSSDAPDAAPPQVSPNDIYSNPLPNPTSPKASPSSRSRTPKVDPFPKPDWADEQVWADFLTNRKRKGLPNTATAYRRLLADIDRIADANWPPGRLLTVATGKGWGALYPSIKTLEDENCNGQRSHHERPSGWAPRPGAEGSEPAFLED